MANFQEKTAQIKISTLLWNLASFIFSVKIKTATNLNRGCLLCSSNIYQVYIHAAYTSCKPFYSFTVGQAGCFVKVAKLEEKTV